jgi:hypothetical protein
VPPDFQVVSTGSFVAVPVFGSATMVSPDGSRQDLTPDQWGRVHFRATQAGRYFVLAGGHTVEIAANYYDASESDLAIAPAPPQPRPPSARVEESAGYSEVTVAPAAMILLVLALIFILTESVLLVRRKSRWGMRHV